MSLWKRTTVVLAFVLIPVILAVAVGTSEILRYRIDIVPDAVYVVNGSEKTALGISVPQQGYRFSWQGSYYELVQSASGTWWAVLALDPHMEGKSKGHTVFLLNRQDPEKPMPEWVMDDRSVLTDMPAYAGYVPLRVMKENVSSLSIRESMKSGLSGIALSRITSPSSADTSAATAMAESLSNALAAKSTLTTYWTKVVRLSEGNRIESNKLYGLILIPGREYVQEIEKIKSGLAAGTSAAYASPGSSMLVQGLVSAVPKRAAAEAPPPPASAPADTTVRLPPVLAIQEVSFSAPYLEGGKEAYLSAVIKNVGPGEGRDVVVEVEGAAPGVRFPSSVKVPTIPANSGVQVVRIPLEGTLDLADGEAAVQLRVVEPNFKVKVTGKRIILPTLAFKAPKLVVAKYAVVEVTSSSPNGQVDLNEVVDLRFALQNQGTGDARDVRLEVECNQKGVMFLGIVEGTEVKRGAFSFTSLEAGKYKDLTYRYFVNSEFEAKELAFRIRAVESFGKFGADVTRSVALNTQLREVGEIVRVASGPAKTAGKVVVEDIPDYVPDVRENIPAGRVSRPDAVAVVIGNRTYKTAGVPPVDFAINDAELIRKYLVKTFGLREGNIIFVTDAAQADFNMIFGTDADHKGKLFNYVKKDVSEVFIYYSGHGAPSPDGKSAYFVPVDCDPAFVKLNGYSLDTFYGNLLKIPYKSLTVVIDSCFSGGFDKGMLLRGISGLTVVPTMEESAKMLVKGNVTVFTSTTGSQVSTWYPEKQHSLFTYYFAKGIQELAARKPAAIRSGELQQYILKEVSYMARRLNGREQTPVLSGAQDLNLVQP